MRALIFDFDGLMIDSESASYQAWCEIYGRYEATLPLELWQRCVGSGRGFDPVSYLEQQLDCRLDGEALKEERHQLKRVLCDRLPLLPGVRDLLEAALARGWALGLASSSPADWVLPHLQRLGLGQHFSSVWTGDRVGEVKPSPELYLRVLEDLDLPARQAVVLEDSPSGAQAALAAGAGSVVVVPSPITASARFPDGVLRLSSLKEYSLPS